MARYASNDLVVILKPPGSGDEERVTVNSHFLALQSDYANAKLNHFHHSNTIAFPDVTLSLWNKAMYYLEPGRCFEFVNFVHPTVGPTFTLGQSGGFGLKNCRIAEPPTPRGVLFSKKFQVDMPAILSFYDRYCFDAGLGMCDRVINLVLDHFVQHGGFPTISIEQAILLAYTYELPLSWPLAKKCIQKIINVQGPFCKFGTSFLEQCASGKLSNHLSAEKHSHEFKFVEALLLRSDFSTIGKKCGRA